MKYAIDYFSAKANLRSKLSAACRSQKLLRHSPSRHCEEPVSEAENCISTMNRHSSSRHRERSVAIQVFLLRRHGLPRRCAPRSDGGWASRISETVHGERSVCGPANCMLAMNRQSSNRHCEPRQRRGNPRSPQYAMDCHVAAFQRSHAIIPANASRL